MKICLLFGSGGGAIEATEEEKELCEQIEAEGIVLLKNEGGALPLRDTEKKIALLGQNSVDFVYGGAGSRFGGFVSRPDDERGDGGIRLYRQPNAVGFL